MPAPAQPCSSSHHAQGAHGLQHARDAVIRAHRGRPVWACARMCVCTHMPAPHGACTHGSHGALQHASAPVNWRARALVGVEHHLEGRVGRGHLVPRAHRRGDGDEGGGFRVVACRRVELRAHLCALGVGHAARRAGGRRRRMWAAARGPAFAAAGACGLRARADCGGPTPRAWCRAEQCRPSTSSSSGCAGRRPTWLSWWPRRWGGGRRRRRGAVARAHPPRLGAARAHRALRGPRAAWMERQHADHVQGRLPRAAGALPRARACSPSFPAGPPPSQVRPAAPRGACRLARPIRLHI